MTTHMTIHQGIMGQCKPELRYAQNHRDESRNCTGYCTAKAHIRNSRDCVHAQCTYICKYTIKGVPQVFKIHRGGVPLEKCNYALRYVRCQRSALRLREKLTNVCIDLIDRGFKQGIYVRGKVVCVRMEGDRRTSVVVVGLSTQLSVHAASVCENLD